MGVVAEALFGALSGFTERWLRLLRALAQAHLDLLQREGAQDAKRLITAAIMAVLGLMFLFFALLGAHLTAVAFLKPVVGSWGLSFGAVSVADLLLCVVLLSAASRKAQEKALLVETRAMLTRTSQILINP